MAGTKKTLSQKIAPGAVLAFAIILSLIVLASPLFFGDKGSEETPGANSAQTTLPSGEGASSTTSQPPAIEPEKGGLAVKVLSEGSEDAVSGATVAISGAENLELVTGTLGEVDFYKITDGSYSIKVSAEGFFGQEVSAEVSPGKLSEISVYLRKSAPETIAPNEGPLPNSGFSEVRVIEASSRSPIIGATVSLTDSKGKPVSTKETVANGTAFFNLPVGGYFATINAAGYYEKKANFVIYENSTVPVLVGLGKKI